MKIIKQAGLLLAGALALFVATGAVAHADDCSVSITAGGLGGGGGQGSNGYSLSIGWGIGISNTASSGNCSVSFSPSESPDGAYSGGSYSVGPGQSFGEGPYKNVRNASVPYPVSASASVSCPAGNAPVAAQGTTASCSLQIGRCTTDGLGNQVCQVDGCADTRTIVCPSVPKPTPTVSISVSPASVQSGSRTTISWSSQNATSCTASGDWSGSKGTSGSEQSGIVWASNKTFDITCTGPGGSASDSATVTWYVIPSAPSVSISGSTQLTVGQTGSWSFSASDSDGDLSQWRFYASSNSNPQWSSISGSSVSGSHSASFSTPGTYGWCVEAQDSRGTGDSDCISVVVNSVPVTPDPAPSVSLSASPTTVQMGSRTTLSWTSQNASSCTASGDWSGSKGTSGSEQSGIFLFGSKTFDITCTGPGGTASDSETVSMGFNPPATSGPVASISGSQALAVNEVGTWSFGATDADSDLSSWRFYASTNPGAQWSNISGGSVSSSYSASFSSPGTYRWIVEAKDSTGASDSASIDVVVGSGSCTGPDCGGGGDPGNTGGPVGGGGTGGTGGGGNNPPVSQSFTISGDSKIELRTLGAAGGTSKEANLNVNPFGGYSSPVTFSVASFTRASDGASYDGTIEYSWGAGAFAANPTKTMVYSTSFSEYTDADSGTIGTTLAVKISKAITERYILTIQGDSSGGSTTYAIDVEPKVVNPTFREI